MDNSKKHNKKNIKPSSYTFYCKECNNIGRIIIQVWSVELEKPTKILLVQHTNYKASVVDEINLIDNEGNKETFHHFCGDCCAPVIGPFDTEVILKKVENKLNTNYDIIWN